MVGTRSIQKLSRPMPAVKDKAREHKKRSVGKTDRTLDFLGVDIGPIEKLSLPMSAVKDKAREHKQRAVGKKGPT